jgi:hypothetical protein
MDENARQPHAFAAGRNARPIAELCPPKGPAGDDPIRLGELIVDREMAVGKGGAQRTAQLRDPTRTGPLAQQRVVLHVARGDDLIGQGQVGVAQELTDQAANDRFVLFC